MQAVTGLVLAGTDIYYPPFGRWIASWIATPGIDPSTIAPYDKTDIDPASWEEIRSFRSVFLTVHYWSVYALLGAIVIHITGEVVTELREGGGIVSAMFSGRKVFDREPRDGGHGATVDGDLGLEATAVMACYRLLDQAADDPVLPGAPIPDSYQR